MCKTNITQNLFTPATFCKNDKKCIYIYKNGKITENLQNRSINAPIIITFALKY